MVILGVDAHKRTHTVVVIDLHGRHLGVRTVGTTSGDQLGLLRWARPVRGRAAVGGRGLPAPVPAAGAGHCGIACQAMLDFSTSVRASRATSPSSPGPAGGRRVLADTGSARVGWRR